MAVIKIIILYKSSILSIPLIYYPCDYVIKSHWPLFIIIHQYRLLHLHLPFGEKYASLNTFHTATLIVFY